MSNMPQDKTLRMFVARHSHRFGVDFKIFQSREMADDIFAKLPETDVYELDSVDFARLLNIDFEPELGEELEIQWVNTTGWTVLDFTKFLNGGLKDDEE